MLLIELFLNYWRWHYSRAILNIILIWKDFIWFLWNYFSIKQLLRTFFVPWKRLREESAGISELFNLFTSVVVTFLMRIIGVIIRSIVIITGLIFILLALAGGVLFLVFWITMPVILTVTLTAGVQMLIKDF